MGSRELLPSRRLRRAVEFTRQVNDAGVVGRHHPPVLPRQVSRGCAGGFVPCGSVFQAFCGSEALRKQGFEGPCAGLAVST